MQTEQELGARQVLCLLSRCDCMSDWVPFRPQCALNGCKSRTAKGAVGVYVPDSVIWREINRSTDWQALLTHHIFPSFKVSVVSISCSV